MKPRKALCRTRPVGAIAFRTRIPGLMMEPSETQWLWLFLNEIDLCQCGLVLPGYVVEDNDIRMRILCNPFYVQDPLGHCRG